MRPGRRDRRVPREDSAAGKRQNAGMRARRPLPALLGALCLGACSTASSYEAGDAAFRAGNYQGAWTIYQAAGDPDDPDLAVRLERTRWFLIEEALREQISAGEGERALALIERLAPEAPADRTRELAELQARAQQRIGARHVVVGLALLEEDQPLEALRELTLAVAWNPEDPVAAEALAKLSGRLQREEHMGEVLYFEGMDHLRTGFDLRARASFHHAAGMLGEDSRAHDRWEGLTQDMAAASRGEARAFLKAGLLGAAFLALRTAERLQPEHPETAELVQALDAKVRSESALAGADLAIRGGKTEVAAEYLEAVKSLGVETHLRAAASLEERNLQLKLEQEYKFARAYELDEQILHAARVYRALLEQAGGFGWNDAELRLSQLERRAAQAEQAFARALAAEAAGDAAAYRAALEETVRFASDYEDALARLAAARADGR